MTKRKRVALFSLIAILVLSGFAIGSHKFGLSADIIGEFSKKKAVQQDVQAQLLNLSRSVLKTRKEYFDAKEKDKKSAHNKLVKVLKDRKALILQNLDSNSQAASHAVLDSKGLGPLPKDVKADVEQVTTVDGKF